MITVRNPREAIASVRLEERRDDALYLRSCPKCKDPSLEILHATWCPWPAFAALLVVAKYVDLMPFPKTNFNDCLECLNQHGHKDYCEVGKVVAALEALDTAHPDWRDW